MKIFILFLFIFSFELKASSDCLSESGFSKKSGAIERAELFDVFFHSDRDKRVLVSKNTRGEILQKIINFENDDLLDACPNVLKVNSENLSFAALSSTHISFLSELNATSLIKAVTQKHHVYNSSIRELVDNNEVLELGTPPRAERFISSGANYILAYVLQEEEIELGTLSRFNERVIFINEFRESDPIARAEWIKFFAHLIGEYELGDAIFSKIKSNYQKQILKYQEKQKSIQVMTGSFRGGRWEASGSKSDFVTLINDLGVNYIFKGEKESSPLHLSSERVLKVQGEVDYWFPFTPNKSLQEIVKGHRVYNLFNQLIKSKVYNPVKRVHSDGANEYWEMGSVRPDLILNDLAIIFYGDDSSEIRWFENIGNQQ